MLTKIRFEAFGTCLAPDLTLLEISALRIWLLSSVENLARLIEFAAARDLLPALEHCLSRYALVPPFGRGGDDEASPDEYLRQIREDHIARRTAMRQHLVAAVRALNAKDIEPLLLKGCASLWEERDPWRQMRDLDILVKPEQVGAARHALASLGFRESPDAEGQRFGHHLPPLIREGMPGWLEVHFRASNNKAEKYVATRDLRSVSRQSARNDARARVLPAPQHAMHGLVHNHFGHRSSSFGTINLKGLQEFAWAVAGMNAADRQSLNEMSFRSARLRAAFELWTSAAASFYRLSLPPGWAASSEAKARAEAALQRTGSGAPEPLVTTFIKTASHALGEPGSEGLPGISWAGRLLARLRAVRAAAREVVVPWRDRASLRNKSAGIRR
jgi:Uncharacterised nucleotidyltransferase